MASEGAGGVVVGLSVAEAAAAVTLLGDDGTGTFAGSEAAAARGAVGVAGADACDELGALGRGGESAWSEGVVSTWEVFISDGS